MKSFKFSFLVLLLLAVLSCKKVDNAATTDVTTDQAADIAASSLASNSNGLTTVTDDVAVNAQTSASVNTGSHSVNSLGLSSVHQACGTTVIDSVTRTSSADSATFNYFFKYTHTLNCNANSQPDNIVNTLNFHGIFNGPNLTSADSGKSTFTIAGLTTTATNFVINGEYKRSGSFQSKVGNKASGNSNVDIVVTNLTLTKPSREIASGTATVSISGTSKKGTFSYTGTLTFNGGDMAALNINGTGYTINLHNGFKIRK